MSSSPRGTTVEEIVPLHQIEVVENLGRIERQRVAPKKLVDNIRRVGLINALVVEKIGPNRYRLVAGENRLLALRELGEKVARCSVRIFASDADARITALSENIHRNDISLYEETLLVHRLVDKHHVSLEELAAKLGADSRGIKTLRAMIAAPAVFNNDQWARFKRASMVSKALAFKYLHAALLPSEQKRQTVFSKTASAKRRRPKPSGKTIESIRGLVDEHNGVRFRGIEMTPRERALASACLSVALGEMRVPFDKPGCKIQSVTKNGRRTLVWASRGARTTSKTGERVVDTDDTDTNDDDGDGPFADNQHAAE